MQKARLKKILKLKPEILFKDRFTLDYYYSFMGHLKMFFGMTAIPNEIRVYDKVENERLGSIRREETLRRLAY